MSHHIDTRTTNRFVRGKQERRADYAAALNHLIVRNGDGSTEGRNPRALTQAELEIGGHLPQPILKVIRAKCLDCSGYSCAEVARCTAVGCALWPYRLGSNPYAKPRGLSYSDPDHSSKEVPQTAGVVGGAGPFGGREGAAS